MEIAKGVEMLHLEFQEYIIHPILLWDDEMAVLIDTGFPGQIEDIRIEMGKVGVSFDKLKAVILTHQDIDHIGSLPELLQNCGSNIKVYAHDLDKPYIEGELPLLKDAQVQNPPKGKVDDTLVDGQELPYCGGILIIHTPTTLDIKEAQNSLKKYLNLEIDSVVCYHGGLSKGNINAQIQEL